MPFFSFALLFCCFLLALASAALATPRKGQPAAAFLRAVETSHLVLFAGLTLACFILASALAACNFSFAYVVMHTDRSLHIFYRLTALWGGQEGALLFWAWCVSLFVLLFQRGASYRSLTPEARRWFWSITFAVFGFFCLLLTSWNNPFLASSPVPHDGYGLNPMLQNPGMIFHPPLLFLGYGALTVPSCLALAALLVARDGKKSKDLAWAALCRPFIMGGWALLSAGIILGAWWSYMELGWGGYWAWDPVENSSLVPWLIATACLHAMLVESATGKLGRANAFLMALTTISAFFSTYLVRSGVIRSVHAFSQSDVGTPLLAFVLLFLAFALLAAFAAPQKGGPLASPLTREGFLTCTAWILLALAAVITVGTMWPVISLAWSPKAVGLSPAFYNTACMPLFALLAAMLAVCPWLGAKGGIHSKGPFAVVCGVFAASCAALALAGFSKPLAVGGSAAAIAVVAGTCMLFSASPAMFRTRAFAAAHGVHFGFALIVLGVAFSGPYKVQRDITLKPGQEAAFGEYVLRLASVGGGDSRDHAPGVASGVAQTDGPPAYIYSEAVIQVFKNGKEAGTIAPQLRRYASYPERTFSEVDTLFSWGNELYCSMLGIDAQGTTTLQISVNPLVNWIWAGSVILCLFPLLGFARRGARRAEETHAAP